MERACRPKLVETPNQKHQTRTRISEPRPLGCVDQPPSQDVLLTCPLKTNPNLERESKDSGVCKEAGNDEEAIHERTDYPQAEGSRS